MTIALALGSGSPRGLEHVGVLKRLISHGIRRGSFWKPAQVIAGEECATLQVLPLILEKLQR